MIGAGVLRKLKFSQAKNLISRLEFSLVAYHKTAKECGAVVYLLWLGYLSSRGRRVGQVKLGRIENFLI